MKMIKWNCKRICSFSKLAGLALGVSVLLSGCGGGGAAEPPGDYVIGDDILPALTKLVALGEKQTFSQEGDGEDQPVTYSYENLESGNSVISEYVDGLVGMYGCSILDEENREIPLPALSEEGSLRVGTEGTNGDGIFVLELQWDASSCAVTPQFEEGVQIKREEAEGLSIEEAVLQLEHFSPQELGLEGEDISQYAIYPRDGIVMVDGKPCFQLDAYLLATHQFEGSYMVSSTGEHVYRLDRKTGQVAEVERY